MTYVACRPVLSLRIVIRIARRRIKGQDQQKKNGVRYKKGPRLNAESRPAYAAAVERNKQLGIDPPRHPRRLKVFRDESRRYHRNVVTLIKTSDEIAEHNRALLSAAVAAAAKKAAMATARSRKREIDATYPKGETHRTSRVERWKDRPRRSNPG